MNKNWANNCRVGCKFSSNLLEFIGIDADLKEELEKLERDEIVNL